MNKKILIIGNTAKDYALAKFLSEKNEVFVASGSDTIKEFATCVDIRESSVGELLEFAMENGIDLTIPTSAKAINTNIVDLFNANNLSIFAPSKASAELIFDKAFLKKVLYKLRVPTPKFGIFEKQNMAFDYIKNLKGPFVLKTNEPSSAVVLTSKTTAKTIIDSAYVQKNQKLIVEDYVWGIPFSFYVVTDGYKALPIGSSIIYKHSLEGDGGQLTSGMGACSPNYKLSLDNEAKLMENVVYPILEYLENENAPYLGILGIDGVLTEDESIQIIGLQPFMQDCDCNAILKIIDTDIVSLMDSCIIGSFSDEVDCIPQKDLSYVSLVMNCKNKDNFQNIIQGLDIVESDINYYPNVIKNRYLEYEAQTGPVLLLSASAKTCAKAVEKIYDDAKCIDFKGIYYRKDICKQTIS